MFLEMDDLVQELDEDVEGMQSTIFFLQQQLREKISTSVANLSSQSSSEHLVTLNISELCAQCRASQEKKHSNCSDSKLIKMEVDNSIDEDPTNRTQDSCNSSDNERTFQNGESELYSPKRGELTDSNSKLTDKRTTRANRHPHFSKQAVSLNAESTSETKNSNNISSKSGLSPQNAQCNNAFDGSGNKNKTNATVLSEDPENKTSDEDDTVEADVLKAPVAKRTKLSSGRSAEVSATGEESKTAPGGLVPRTRNGSAENP